MEGESLCMKVQWQLRNQGDIVAVELPPPMSEGS